MWPSCKSHAIRTKAEVQKGIYGTLEGRDIKVKECDSQLKINQHKWRQVIHYRSDRTGVKSGYIRNGETHTTRNYKKFKLSEGTDKLKWKRTIQGFMDNYCRENEITDSSNWKK